MTAFPLPPTYRLRQRRSRWVAFDGARPVSWAWRDTYQWRVRLWEHYLGWV